MKHTETTHCTCSSDIPHIFIRHKVRRQPKI